jgi:hypothetical protein
LRDERKNKFRRRGVAGLDNNSTYLFAIKVAKLTCSKDGKVVSTAYDVGATVEQLPLTAKGRDHIEKDLFWLKKGNLIGKQ